MRVNKKELFEGNSFGKLMKLDNDDALQKSSDILYTSDFLFDVFSDYGDSGILFLATNKNNFEEKYIVKHEYSDCACNEYIYSKVANAMGIKVPSVKLFMIDDNENLFRSNFVCGVKYLDDCVHVNFNYIKKNKSKIKNWHDYFRMYSLEGLFEEDDGVEIVMYKDEIYRLDLTSAFSLSNYYIDLLVYDYDKNIVDEVNALLLNLAHKNTGRFMWFEIVLENGIKHHGEEFLSYYLETFNLLKKVTEKDIERWTNTLILIYPKIIGEYFKLYFKNLKMDAEEFVEKVTRKELLTV